MDAKKMTYPIRSALTPVFYQNFRCLAQDCRDSCCVNWGITFDKKDYLRLRRLDAPEELKQRLEKGVRRRRTGNDKGVTYGNFVLDANNGRCPFLDPDGLCAIQRTCGHEALPMVCTTYPRKVQYSPAAKEYSLSPSCEGVLQQLWDLPEGVAFVEDPLPKAEQRTMTVLKGETLTQDFTPLRGLCIDILQDRSMPLANRMLCLGVVLQRLLGEDWTELDSTTWVEGILSSIHAIADMTKNISGSQDMYLMQNLKVLNAIGLSKKRWTAGISEALEVEQSITLDTDEGDPEEARITANYSSNAYEEALGQFKAAFAGREYFFENLMVAVALYLGFPDLSGKEALWKSYVSLCSLYSFYRFVAVLGCKGEATKERLFHYIVMASRATLHNRDRFNGFQEELFQHDSSTLAHMAILLCG